MSDDFGTYTFTCVRDKVKIIVQCNADAPIDEVVEVFKDWLAAVGYHPDSIKREFEN